MSIPQTIKMSQGLARSEQYAGEIDPQQLPRLKPQLAGPSPNLQVSLGFERDPIGSWLRGRLSGSLELECSRCETVFAWPLSVAFDLRLVRSEAEAQDVLQEADPYLVQDDRLPLVEMVEDEVLLALPMLPRCAACEKAKIEAPPEPEKSAKVKEPNPFAQLLKK